AFRFQDGAQAPLAPLSHLTSTTPSAGFLTSTTTSSVNVPTIQAFEEHETVAELKFQPNIIPPPGDQELESKPYRGQQDTLCCLVSTPRNSSTNELSKAEESMKAAKSKATIGVLSTLITYLSLNSLYKSLNPEAFIWQDEDREEASWLASSRSWFDRKTCRWLGLCGVAHFRAVGRRFGHHVENSQKSLLPAQNDSTWQTTWTASNEALDDWSEEERRQREIPDYVMEFAPLVYLYSGEQFWPCDIAEHLYHITPKLNYTPIQAQWDHPSLKDLDDLNEWEHGRNVFLTSDDNPEERPDWIEGEKNIPETPSSNSLGDEESWTDWDESVDSDLLEDLNHDRDHWYDVGKDSTRDRGGDRNGPDHHSTPIPSDTAEGEDFLFPEDKAGSSPAEDLKHRSHKPLIKKHIVGGRSGAPAVLITVDKGDGVIDAFWFFFYSFNLGNVVFNIRFGNHVGDWEHCMIRFHHGVPKAVFFSEHSFGDAYSFEALEKIGKRPVIYSAEGSHAMYATPGTHAYILPWGLLHDVTDRGPLWDPALNVHSYTYDYLEDDLRSSNRTPTAPTEWFYFNGHWGDKFYPLSDSRQYRFAGQYHYVNGPLGPRFKNLGRRKYPFMHPPNWREPITYPANNDLSSTVASLLTMATTSSIPTSLLQIATIPYTSTVAASIHSQQSSSTIPASTTITAPASTTSPPPGDPENTGKCELLGSFAILVQAALGALALLVLVYKRWRERPQRPVKIWAFDASKQVFGSVLLHLLNLVMSMFSAGQVPLGASDAFQDEEYTPNPCSFYLLNLGIDTTIGIPILIVLLRIIHVGASYTPIARPPESIQSGYYGDPPRATWWLKQSILYFIGLLGMKFCVFLIFELLPWIIRVGDWALRWTEGNTAVQIAFVMLIFPTIMNAAQYYIIDTFIKKRTIDENGVGKGDEADAADGDDDNEEQGRLLGESDRHGEAEERVDGMAGVKSIRHKSGASMRESEEYDPSKDGEVSETSVVDRAATGVSGEENPANKSFAR
ncbi:MAG: hypothetical protein Q9227_003130, partial [Pyrenula ochraceoflavens]